MTGQDDWEGLHLVVASNEYGHDSWLVGWLVMVCCIGGGGGGVGVSVHITIWVHITICKIIR